MCSAAKSPKVSVIIPVFNAEPYVGQAIQSILDQTFLDFELLVIDDASTDGSLDVIYSFGDSRIRVLRNKVNRKQAYTQNVGLCAARSEYIAILGADDIATPKRLEIQVSFLDTEPDVCMVGTWFHRINAQGDILGLVKTPVDPLAVRWCLLFGNPIGASTVMIRREVIRRVGGFEETCIAVEDMELWGRIAQCEKIAQLDIPLTRYRVHSQSLTHRESTELKEFWLAKHVQRNIERLTGARVSEPVAKCLSVLPVEQPFDVSTIDHAYAALERCYKRTVKGMNLGHLQRRELLILMLNNLQRMARRSPQSPRQALRMALSLALRFAPESIFTQKFGRFVWRLTVPDAVRARLQPYYPEWVGKPIRR